MAAGVVKVLNESDRSFYTAADVMDIMGVSRDKAYKMIKALQDDMKAQGKMGKAYPGGKAPKWLFDRYYMLVETNDM